MSASHPDRELVPVTAELFVENVEEAIRFYTGTLGFSLMRKDEVGGLVQFAVVELHGAPLMLMDDRFFLGDRAGLSHRGSGVDIRIMVPDADEVYRRAQEAGLTIAHDIDDRAYGLRDFIMIDPFGFRLRFAQALS